MLTFRISRTKAKQSQTKPNQTESNRRINTTNEQTTCAAFFVVAMEKETSIKEDGAQHTPHAYMIVRSFNASAICFQPFAFTVQLIHSAKGTPSKRENDATNYTLSSATYRLL